jgi:hypothetical protein
MKNNMLVKRGMEKGEQIGGGGGMGRRKGAETTQIGRRKGVQRNEKDQGSRLREEGGRGERGRRK